MTDSTDIDVLDPITGAVVVRCTGPAPDGECPAADVGDLVPCAGQAVAPAGVRGAQPFAVPGGATTCPVAWALALATSPETAFLDG